MKALLFFVAGVMAGSCLHESEYCTFQRVTHYWQNKPIQNDTLINGYLPEYE